MVGITAIADSGLLRPPLRPEWMGDEGAFRSILFWHGSPLISPSSPCLSSSGMGTPTDLTTPLHTSGCRESATSATCRCYILTCIGAAWPALTEHKDRTHLCKGTEIQTDAVEEDTVDSSGRETATASKTMKHGFWMMGSGHLLMSLGHHVHELNRNLNRRFARYANVTLLGLIQGWQPPTALYDRALYHLMAR